MRKRAAPAPRWGGAASVTEADQRDPRLQPPEQDAEESSACPTMGGAASVTEADQLDSQLQALRTSSHPLALDFLRALRELTRVATTHMSTEMPQPGSGPPDEKRRLEQQLADQQELLSQLQARNLELEREVLELRRSQGAPGGPQGSARRRPAAPPAGCFPVQVRTTGKTGGCEKRFLEEVANHLVGSGVFVTVEEYRKDSDRFLLVFCPVTSRMGTDIDNALEGLGGTQNAILVVLHHKPKDSGRFRVDTKRQVQHHALVVTVYAFYSMQDGFYACDENGAAVASVVAAIRNRPRES